MTQILIPGTLAREFAQSEMMKFQNGTQRQLKSAKLMALKDASIMPTLAALKLDAVRTNWIGRKGDLLLFLTEKDLGTGRRPCLLIANANNPTVRHVFFKLEDLWMIVSARAQEVAMKMAEQLYGFVTRDDAFRVLDALFDFGEDLKNAPPPRWISHQQWLNALAEDGMTFYKNGESENG